MIVHFLRVITGVVTRVTIRAPLVQHMSSSPGFQWVSCCSIFSFLCNVLEIIVCLFFLLVIVLSVLRLTDSGYSFDIFKLFLVLILQSFSKEVQYYGNLSTSIYLSNSCSSLSITDVILFSFYHNTGLMRFVTNYLETLGFISVRLDQHLIDK